MTEQSFLWTTSGTGDGSASGYSAANLFDIFRALFTGATANAGGVAPDFGNELAVSGTSSPVSVASGAAIVYGIPYVNTAPVTVVIPTPSTSTRVDRIVLRANWTAQTVRITRIAGTEGAGAPSMTQSAGATWDIPLATASITTGGAITVTDGREYASAVGDGEVDTAKLADNAVTAAKMADNAINTAELVDASVTLAKMASLSQATVIGRASGAGTGVPVALTASQLMTILLAADGAGSGLDADLLDGWSGLRYRLVSSSSASDDPNATDEPIIVTNHANVPATGYWYVLTLFYNTTSTSRAQIAIEYGDTTDPRMYIRAYYPSTWSSWIQVITSVSGIAAGSITATELASNAVTTAKILDNAVTNAKLADNAVNTAELAANAVTTAKIADLNVTTDKLADDAVTTAKIAAAAVTATELASNAVTTAKILDDNVTQAKIAAGAVGTTELADDAVTNAKIGVGAVGSTELASNAVTTAAINNNAVTNAKLATMSAATVKGRASGAGLGDPADLSAAQVAAIVATGDPASSNLSVNAGWSISGGLKIYEFANGLVFVTGTIVYSSGGANPFSLSAGQAPAQVRLFPLPGSNGSMYTIQFNTDGTVNTSTVAAGVNLYINAWYMSA